MADITQFNPDKFTIKQLLDLQPEVLQGLNESQLRDVTARLASAANKRIARLNKIGAESPALVRPDGKKVERFTTSKKQSTFRTKVELRQLRSFLKSKTSTVSGYRKFEENVRKGFASIGADVSGENLKDFLEILNRVRDEEGISSKEFLYSVADAISDAMKDYRGRDKEKIFDDIMSRIDEIYRNQERSYTDEPDIFDLFRGPNDELEGFGPNFTDIF